MPARKGVPAAEWVEPVVAEVDASLPEFEQAYDDESAWGPAKTVAAELARRGVDLTDRAAVGGAMRELNAEGLSSSGRPAGGERDVAAAASATRPCSSRGAVLPPA